jgi:hypothetical protein
MEKLANWTQKFWEEYSGTIDRIVFIVVAGIIVTYCVLEYLVPVVLILIMSYRGWLLA